jgi:hypothetical protein
VPRAYQFTVTLTGVSDLTDDLQGALLKAGCDDASLWSEGETVFLDFSRTADSLRDAVGSAIKDVEGCGYKVAHVAVV